MSFPKTPRPDRLSFSPPAPLPPMIPCKEGVRTSSSPPLILLAPSAQHNHLGEKIYLNFEQVVGRLARPARMKPDAARPRSPGQLCGKVFVRKDKMERTRMDLLTERSWQDFSEVVWPFPPSWGSERQCLGCK